MTDSEILNKVILIASKHSGISADQLSAGSSINFDLQIDGDDIEDMIAELNREFDLNFEGFDYSRYFNSESEINLFTSLFGKLFGRVKYRSKHNYDFKLGDFVRWISEGYWKEAKATKDGK